MRGFYKKRYLGIFSAVLLLIATIVILGTDENQCPPRLAHIDSLMETNPQAAYDSLLHIDSTHIYDDDKPMEMRMLMLKAKAQNKLYLPMPSDSTFNEVVAYYDRHGSANDRMLSRYLLGCIYRDMRDAPKALESFIEATEQADTTKNNCDYITLFSVYGQQAELYKMQHLPHEALKEFKKYIYYAEKARDTVSSCFGHEAMAYLYYTLGDTVSTINKVKECYSRYLKLGMRKEGAGVFPLLIYICLERGQFGKARHYMDMYEGGAGLFDSSNNIMPGREHYYKIRGMYCLGTGKIDSAEYYYRKLGCYGYSYESAQGLLNVYSVTNNQDSVSKYTRLCEVEMDSILKRKKSDELMRVSLSHTFNRPNTKTKYIKTVLAVVALLLIIVILALLFYSKKSYRKYKGTIAHLNSSLNDFQRLSASYKQAVCDIARLKSQLDKNDKRHKDEIARLNDEKQRLSVSLSKYDIGTSMAAFKKTAIFQMLEKKSRGFSKSCNNIVTDWSTIEKQFLCHFPLVYTTLTEGKRLSRQELRVCMLLWLGFDNNEICILTDASAQTVSNSKTSANEKIFSDKSAKSLLANMRRVSIIATEAKRV